MNLILEIPQKELFKDIYLLAFNTGMRLGEIVHMRWNWIDVDRKILVIKHTDSFLTKGKKERIIPLNRTLFFPRKSGLWNEELTEN